MNVQMAACVNPLDATCWLQNAAQWMTQQVMGALHPVVDALLGSPLSILWLLLVLSGPGLACFALPQTLVYEHMWLSLTASTVLVQFFQVLDLGSLLLTSLGAANLSGSKGHWRRCWSAWRCSTWCYASPASCIASRCAP